MTIGGILVGIVLSICIIICIGGILFSILDKPIISIIITTIALIGLWGGLIFYYNGTASGRRELVDQKAELQNGLDRTINIYTANGDLIATYTGKIDLEDNEGGYVLFDYNGKRYTYYNCFVESIANIE